MTCETRIMLAALARLMQLEELEQPLVVWRQNVGGAVDRTGRGITFGEAGQPDLMLVVRGRFVGIETKSEDGSQSKKQKAWQKRIEAAGGIYWIARTIEEAVEPVIKLLGLAGRATWSKDHWEFTT